MILLTERAESPYYAGLNLVALGILSFFPWSKKFLIGAILTIFAPYYLSLAVIGVDGPGLKALYIHSFFVIGTIVASSVIRWFSEDLKKADIASRLELEEKNMSLNQAMDNLKKTEADLVQSQKLASLGTIAALLAHEINNSMNYAGGSAEIAKNLLKSSPEFPQKAQLEDCLRLISEGTGVTSAIIDNVQSYSGVNRAKYSLIDIRQVIDSAIKISTLKLQEGHKRIQVIIEVEDSKFLGSVVGLYQIITNLISNAVDAIDETGKIRILGKNSNSHYVLEFEDNGRGIAEDTLKRIFEPFYTTKGEKGTGLGMHIVRSEMEKHKGEISIESKVGVGTTVRLQFPTNLRIENGVLI